MADEIQKLDLGDAAEQLKTKIQSAFIDLIPAEKWQAMIEGELTKFTTETRTPDSYYSNSRNKDKVTPPAFETMAQGILLDVARDKLKSKLEETDFLPDGKTVEGIIRGWLEANLDTMVSHFMREVVSNISMAMATSAAGSLSAIITQTMPSGVGMPNPQNPGYDMAGNYIG